MSSRQRSLAFAVASARSMSAISSGENGTSHDVSRLSVSPRQALEPLIGFVQIELIDGTSSGRGAACASIVPWVEGVAEAIPQHVESHHDGEDGEAGIEGHPGSLEEIALGGVEHAAP